MILFYLIIIFQYLRLEISKIFQGFLGILILRNEKDMGLLSYQHRKNHWTDKAN